MKHPYLFLTCLAVACGDDAAPALDAADTGADIATTLQCGPTPPVGAGNVAEFQRATIDTARFPDALCNDGTPAIVYFRPYNGEANRNKWVLNLHGGGTCFSGASCAARWCNCDNTTVCPHVENPTQFNRLTMTNASQSQKAADGVFHRGGTGAQTNPIGDYNQVELSYCSSDAWKGTQRSVTLSATNPVTGAPVEFTLHFLGARILDGVLAWLRQDGAEGLLYTIGGGSVALPDLDEATEVIVTGDSAGGSGVISNLDDIAALLRATNANPSGLAVRGLIDAIVGVDRSLLDYGAYRIPEVRSYDDYLSLRAASATEPGARNDASCVQAHAADPRPCLDESHVIRHHVTTPFFVRMALRDSLIGGGYVEEMLRDASLQPLTINSFALLLHDELGEFDQLSMSAEEGQAFTREPGVFGPACTKHDTIHSNVETFMTTITPADGTPRRLMQVFENWRTGSGTPTNILTESPTLADTNCP